MPSNMPVKNIALTLPLSCLEYRLAYYLRQLDFEKRIRMKEKEKKAEKRYVGLFPQER